MRKREDGEEKGENEGEAWKGGSSCPSHSSPGDKCLHQCETRFLPSPQGLPDVAGLSLGPATLGSVNRDRACFGFLSPLWTHKGWK